METMNQAASANLPIPEFVAPVAECVINGIKRAAVYARDNDHSDRPPFDVFYQVWSNATFFARQDLRNESARRLEHQLDPMTVLLDNSGMQPRTRVELGSTARAARFLICSGQAFEEKSVKVHEKGYLTTTLVDGNKRILIQDSLFSVTPEQTTSIEIPSIWFTYYVNFKQEWLTIYGIIPTELQQDKTVFTGPIVPTHLYSGNPFAESQTPNVSEVPEEVPIDLEISERVSGSQEIPNTASR